MAKQPSPRTLSPEVPVVSYPTPNINDLMVVQDVDSRAPNYVAAQYGDLHPDQVSYPGLKLVYQTPLDQEANYMWVRRVYAKNRADQDTYNYAIKYAGSDPNFPTYIRTYAIPRSEYQALPRGSVDPLFPKAPNGNDVVLNTEEVDRYKEDRASGEDQLDSIYVKVTRVYITLPGPTIFGGQVDTRFGIPVLVEKQSVPAGVGPSVVQAEDGSIRSSDIDPVDTLQSTRLTSILPALPEPQVWYGTRQVSGLPPVLVSAEIVGTEQLAFVPHFEECPDGPHRARYTRTFSFGPPTEEPELAHLLSPQPFNSVVEYSSTRRSTNITEGTSTTNGNQSGTSESTQSGTFSSTSEGTSHSTSSTTTSSTSSGTSESTQSGTSSSTSSGTSSTTSSGTSSSTSSGTSESTQSGTFSSTNSGTNSSTQSGTFSSTSSGTTSTTSSGTNTSSQSGTNESTSSGTSSSTSSGTSRSTQSGTSSSSSGSNFSKSSSGSVSSEENAPVLVGSTVKNTIESSVGSESSNNSSVSQSTSSGTTSGTSEGTNSSTSNGTSSSTSNGTSSSTSNGTNSSTTSGTSSSTSNGTSSSTSSGTNSSTTSGTSSNTSEGTSSSTSEGTSTSTSEGTSTSTSSGTSSSTSTGTSESTSDGTSSGTSRGTNDSTSSGTSSSTSTSTSEYVTNSTSTGTSTNLLSISLPRCLRGEITVISEAYANVSVTIPATSPETLPYGEWYEVGRSSEHWKYGVWITETVEVRLRKNLAA